MEYFAPVSKPKPPREGMREFLLYVDELSVSWDNLYEDRTRAGEIIREGLKGGG
jgi:hypothetical protein